MIDIMIQPGPEFTVGLALILTARWQAHRLTGIGWRMMRISLRHLTQVGAWT
jgi:hypothetical protein